jgi:hypothetical protein
LGACRHVLATKPETQLRVEAGTVLTGSSAQEKNYSWSALLKRVFEIDVLVCEQCGGPVRLIAAIQEP